MSSTFSRWKSTFFIGVIGIGIGFAGTYVFHFFSSMESNLNHRLKYRMLKTKEVALRKKHQLLLLQYKKAQSNVKKQEGKVDRYPVKGWLRFFPKKKPSLLLNAKAHIVEQKLGKAPFAVRGLDGAKQKQLWVYFTSKSDSTALYLFFENQRLKRSRLDEFSGILSTDQLK